MSWHVGFHYSFYLLFKRKYNFFHPPILFFLIFATSMGLVIPKNEQPTMRYYDPRYDITFKEVFSHPELLISFLNALLPLKDDEQVEGIEYLSPEMLPETPTNKFSVVDVCCKDRKNRQFIVEMQMVWSEELKSRVLLNEIQTLKP